MSLAVFVNVGSDDFYSTILVNNPSCREHEGNMFNVRRHRERNGDASDEAKLFSTRGCMKYRKSLWGNFEFYTRARASCASLLRAKKRDAAFLSRP
jgi:hypothetical protein